MKKLALFLGSTLSTGLLMAQTVTACFNMSTTVCANYPVQAFNCSTGATSYTWMSNPSTAVTFSPSQNAVNPDLTFANPGTYTITLFASNGSTIDSASQVVNVISCSPSACFNMPTTTCANDTVGASNCSTGATSYTWMSNPSTGVTFIPNQNATNPSVIFANAGTYTIELIASNGSTSSTTSQVVNVTSCSSSVTACFTMSTTVCANYPVQAFNCSTGATSYTWVSNPSTAVTFSPSQNAVNPDLAFANTGTYTITLFASNGSTIDSASQVVNVISCSQPVTACFNMPTTTCANDTVGASNCSTGATSYTWMSNPSTGVTFIPNQNATNPSVTFANAGTYTIELIASNGSTSSSASQVVNVVSCSSVIACFNMSTTVCDNDVVNISNCSMGATSYTWTSNPSTGVTFSPNQNATNPIVTFANAGTYTIELIASDGSMSSTASQVVSVISCTSTTACFNMTTTVCVNDSVGVSNCSTGATSYTWTSNPSTGVTFSPNQNATNPVVTFTNTGTYTITLVASNGSTTDMTSQVVNVGFCSSVTACWSMSTTICANSSIGAFNCSTGATSYTWVSNPSTGVTFSPSQNAVNPNLTFANVGTYTITLFASNGSTIDSASQVVNVISCSSPVTACLSMPTTICTNDSVYVNNCSTGATSYTWMSNPSTGVTFIPNQNATNPSVTFANAGTYTIELIASDGSTSSNASQVVNVVSCSSVTACFNMSTTVNVNDSLYISNCSTGANSYTWTSNPSTGVTFIPNQNATHPIVTFANAGTYTIVLTASNGSTSGTASRVVNVTSPSAVTEINSFANNIAIVPNPSNGLFNIITTFNEKQNIKFEVLNTLGQVLNRGEFQNVMSNYLTLNLSNYENGVYFLHITNGSEKVVKKIVINK